MMSTAKRKVILLTALVMGLAIPAYAHNYSGGPIAGNCTSGRLCVYLGLDYSGSEYESSVKVNQWPEPWEDSEDSAYNRDSSRHVRVFEGPDQVGDSYCFHENSGVTDLPFHHDNQGDSHNWYSDC